MAWTRCIGWILSTLLSLGYCMPALGADAGWRFGVNAPRDGRDAEKWQALGAYFAAALGQPVQTVGLPTSRIGAELLAGAVGFALVNPATAVDVLEHPGIQAIASLKVNGGIYFAGTIIARRDRRITTLADIRGKDVLASQTTSAGGHVFPLYHLLRNGIDPRKDLKSLRHNNKQDEIVLSVLAGRIDVGCVRSGVLESLVQEGKLKHDELVVIDERQDELKLRHTTELYPEWVLLASNRLDAPARERLRRAALSLKPSMPAAREAGIDGFAEPASLERVKEALRALRLPPFQAPVVKP
ncbi:MAG: phosphate/phosphite/phosphonate ABC transporter substrate-binding protein [Pseudomonadota bacterium]